MYLTDTQCPNCGSLLVQEKFKCAICGRCSYVLPYQQHRKVGAVLPGVDDIANAEAWRVLATVARGLTRLPPGLRDEVVFSINRELEDQHPFVFVVVENDNFEEEVRVRDC